MITLALISIFLLTFCTSNQTTFKESVFGQISNPDIDTLSIYIFRYSLENSRDDFEYRTTTEKEKIDDLIKYLNTLSLQKIKNIDINDKDQDIKYMILLNYRDVVSGDDCSVEITTQDYENLQITLELPNQVIVKKNYKILNDKFDKYYLEKLYGSI
ncbi:hypothetical protein KQI88_05630 [Alkaliphilus sp. MSJ-5]|uniref:Uncharacterized protein n=1 Tax=Alkaliphilus flagellatus TaxID=2841507 RepID=A0ABS6G0K1_9FIRM|nr:hypothetical protein [Alkaliphilus flagellatus]MBU5675888.1 hypothetical protein [Alkaliphilus flagellatus]